MIEIKQKVLDFYFDQFHKNLGEKLKSFSHEDDMILYRKQARKENQELLELHPMDYDIQKLKLEFADLLLEKNSSKLLWELNSTYIDSQYDKNLLDCVSPIFEKSNQVVRKGVNRYKANGWLNHCIYVYQIVNYNVAEGILLVNFGEEEYAKECIEELHSRYLELDSLSQFILRVFTLIHDIGVIDSVKDHPVCGVKYVEAVFSDIGVDDAFLNKHDIPISMIDLISFYKGMIQYHTLFSGLSAEGSDKYVEEEWLDLLDKMPKDILDQKDIAKLLYIFTIADVIGVSESIFDEGKYKRIKDAYYFFLETAEGKSHQRDKRKVSIERIIDIAALPNTEEVKKEIENTLDLLKIEKESFWNDLYHMKRFRFISPIMKEVKGLKNVVLFFHSVLNLVIDLYGKENLENTYFTWIPNNQEKRFVETIKDGSFFECLAKKGETKVTYLEWKGSKLNIEKRDGDIFIDLETLKVKKINGRRVV